MAIIHCVFLFILANIVYSLDDDDVHSLSLRHLLQAAGSDCLISANTIVSTDDPNFLMTDSGVYFVRIESTGQLVIYEGGLNARDELQRIPTTASAEDVYTLQISPDHLLQIVASDNTVVWQSDNTPDGANPDNAKLIIQPNGNLILFDLDSNMPLWSPDPDPTRVRFAVADDYAAAQAECAPFGLFTIRNEDDILTLRAAAAATGAGLTGQIWVGVDDLDTMDGSWVFDDGSCCVLAVNDCQDLDFWATGEPATDGQCAQFDLDEADNTMVLSGIDCTTDLRFACNARDVADTDCSTDQPTTMPSENPTTTPSSSPSETPSTTPTSGPTQTPSSSPSQTPTTTPSSSPSTSPTTAPTTPTNLPSTAPSSSPTTPTNLPSTTPTSSPSNAPSITPTAATDSPTRRPTTVLPTELPSRLPTEAPFPALTVATSSPTVTPDTPSPTLVNQHPLWDILSDIFGNEIAAGIIQRIYSPEFLAFLVSFYRSDICEALDEYDLTADELALFYELLNTSAEQLDCDNLSPSESEESLPSIGSIVSVSQSVSSDTSS